VKSTSNLSTIKSISLKPYLVW